MVVWVSSNGRTIFTRRYYPISHTRDTAGPIAHTVSDVILIDELITQEPRKESLQSHQIRLGINSYFWNHLDEDVHEQAHIALELLKVQESKLFQSICQI